MSATLSTLEKAQIRRDNDSYLGDTCIIQAYTESTDAVGEPTFTYTDGAPESCRFMAMLKQAATPREAAGPEGTLLQVDAAIQLPVSRFDAVNDTRQRVKLTHRNGEALTTPQIYEVVGIPKLGTTFVHLNLRKRRR